MTLAALLLLALLPAADIQGTVRAEGSGVPIPRATVQLVELKRSATTDERGAFVLRGVAEGRWTVRTSAPGYRPHSVVVQATGGASVRLDVDLRPEAVRLTPALAGADVLRPVPSLASVATISDFSGAPHVRGGSPDQDPITPDGIPLHDP